MKEIFSILDMLNFARWAIHSGKCHSNPTIEDIQEWILEEQKKPFQGNLLPDDLEIDN